MISQEEFVIKSSKRREFINITNYIEIIVKKSKIKNGLAHIFVPHATCALIANEDEPLIKRDYLNLLEKIVPENKSYFHNQIDNNADSHLLSMLLKPFLIFPVKDGGLARGTWQEIFIVELDGPKTRRVIVTLIGE